MTMARLHQDDILALRRLSINPRRAPLQRETPEIREQTLLNPASYLSCDGAASKLPLSCCSAKRHRCCHVPSCIFIVPMNNQSRFSSLPECARSFCASIKRYIVLCWGIINMADNFTAQYRLIFGVFAENVDRFASLTLRDNH
jgi:hypothetical protein